MGETQFETAVAAVKTSTAKSAAADFTPLEMALACRKTFAGVEALLETLLEDLSYDDSTMESIKDSKDSLNKIRNEYWNLKKKGGLEKEVLDDIKAFLPGLNKAITYISSALDYPQIPEHADNKVKYDALPIYKQRILDTYEQVANINIDIRMRADLIKSDSIAKDKP